MQGEYLIREINGNQNTSKLVDHIDLSGSPDLEETRTTEKYDQLEKVGVNQKFSSHSSTNSSRFDEDQVRIEKESEQEGKVIFRGKLRCSKCIELGKSKCVVILVNFSSPKQLALCEYCSKNNWGIQTCKGGNLDLILKEFPNHPQVLRTQEKIGNFMDLDNNNHQEGNPFRLRRSSTVGQILKPLIPLPSKVKIHKKKSRKVIQKSKFRRLSLPNQTMHDDQNINPNVSSSSVPVGHRIPSPPRPRSAIGMSTAPQLESSFSLDLDSSKQFIPPTPPLPNPIQTLSTQTLRLETLTSVKDPKELKKILRRIARRAADIEELTANALNMFG